MMGEIVGVRLRVWGVAGVVRLRGMNGNLFCVPFDSGSVPLSPTGGASDPICFRGL